MFAVNGLPNEVEIEVDVGSVGQFHIDFVAFKLDSLDARLREISADEGVDFGIVRCVGACTVAAAIVDDVEVVVELDVVVVVEFNFPTVVFLLDLVDVVVGEVGGHVGRDLFGHEACGDEGVNRRMLAVHFNPVERVVEFQLGLVVELHLVVMLCHLAAEDAGLREVGLHKLHDAGVDVAVADGNAGFFHLVLVRFGGGFYARVFVGRGSVLLATGHRGEG